MSSPHTLHNYPPLGRGQTVRRIPELIDGLKAEYDTLLRDTNVFVMQRDEYEKQLEYHRQEAQRIQDQLFELEHYHKEIVGRYQDEIEYLKRQLEMADHNNAHDNSHVLNSMKYDKQRVLLPPGGGARGTAFSPSMPPNLENRVGGGGLPGVLSSLKSDPGPIPGVAVAGVVAGRGGGGAGRGMPPAPAVRGGPGPLRGSVGGNGRPVERGVLVGAPVEGGEESSSGVVIEEQDIVMASVNPSDK